ncbi:DNA-binding protein [Actinoplanes sp. NBRC 14428]|uniref:Helix-turn-helix protein n=1 Tax=Pseudosporangium ferrugineum TaxID=439699 RepID=A0A2T0SEG1_9ACTN|nr:helix-turn-helix transcriptional regulator [Pseudosporangium ferrugineum]PRY31808.1 helix-turn-helix protein [Pseudosporangium ferrugineum]BCJ49959.1 DNA-binding protein [Actinoplanes sp. NBRC 14428]
MDREELADFLRYRRAALVPDRPAGRKTRGLRREEVAARAFISADYYTRLEQRRGPRPSPEVAAALSRALELTTDERDHLFRLIGHNPPQDAPEPDGADPGLRRVLHALDRSPAMVVSNLGRTLLQNDLALALFGDQTQHEGPAASGYFRWFTMPEERGLYPPDIHEQQSATYVAAVRAAADLEPDPAEGARLIAALRAHSPEFRRLWEHHEVRICRQETTSLLHPAAGRLDFDCEVVFSDSGRQRLLIFTPRDDTTVRAMELVQPRARAR